MSEQMSDGLKAILDGRQGDVMSQKEFDEWRELTLRLLGRPKTLTQTGFFAPVRKTADSGKEWIDVDEISYTRTEIQARIRKTAERIPNWDASNPIVRIVEVVISERATILGVGE